MKKKGNQKSTHFQPRRSRPYSDAMDAIDERCLHRPDDEEGKPVHPWKDAIEKDCIPVCEDDSNKRCCSVEESKPTYRRDPIPSDWLEKGTHYDPEGNLIVPEGVYDDPVIPEESDNS